MDRRRRSGSLPSLTFAKNTLPRAFRRPLALLRRAACLGDLQYAAVSFILLVTVTTIIFLLGSRPTSTLAYPILSAHHDVRDGPSSSGSGSASSGSARELDELLHRVTNMSATTRGPSGTSSGRLVVAVAVNYAFRRLALNFICNLKRLRIENYVVLAMDRAVFDFLAKRNANVFFYDLNPQRRRRLLSDEDHFGTAAFVETSRRKSLLVLKALRLGYSVLFSDVDVVWVRNPIPELLAHTQDFVMQSDRANKDRDAALNYNLNSGFYLARSSPRSVTALQAIVKYAQTIRRSEQKAFNYVLCGAFKDHHAGPGLRVGSNECTYRKSGATAKALSLDTFPNGSDELLWSGPHSSFVATYPQVIAAHANYVEGRAEKVERIRNIGFWLHSEESERQDECSLRSHS